MQWLKLTLAYDGTDFCGWQVQPQQRSVQGVLQDKLQEITGEEVRAIGSGRTDSGVHALAQVVGFSTSSELSPKVLHRALNAELPDDLSVLSVEPAPEGFHAIRDARRKHYRYTLHDSRVPEVFERRYLWQVFQRLDVSAMQRAARPLIGTHDFSSFESKGAPREDSIRTVYDLKVRRTDGDDSHRITIDIQGNGFLYNMVRTIVGTLYEVGRNNKPETWPGEVLAARNRDIAGMTAPAQGLFLVNVEY
jgi:tRNA pseudouridine38-40 synthase